MDFKTVSRNVVAGFSEEGVAYAVIGGFALGAWGIYRSTVDMDFLVRRDDMPKVHVIMQSLGYGVRFESENVTQFTSRIAALGEVDFLHAFREASLGMLERAVEKTFFQDGVSMKVLIPEDLIGLKLQAFANDATREAFDMRDIERLMKLHANKMDWNLIGEYFEIFEVTALFENLREKYCGPR